MKDQVSENELTAVRTIVSVLESLEVNARQRVLMFALGQLGITRVTMPTILVGESSPIFDSQSDLPETIRSLKKKKSPKYATEMAVIVGYFLAEVAPAEQRKLSISHDDIRSYFRKADFKLPKSVTDVLIHAKQSGYFEAHGDGKYELTPLGRDLVINRLPKKGKSTNVRSGGG